jgi:translation elongation factor EF-Tu-like GTPase
MPMTIPPMESPGPQLWMHVADIFQIKGRGTVLTGQLQGSGFLAAGDTMVCDGQRWQVSAIEQFRAILQSAAPGANIGVLLKGGPPADMLRGRTVGFEPGAGAGASSQWTPLAPKKNRWRR